MEVTYNVDGTPSQRTDQRGTVIAYSYDNLRRPQSQKVTTLGGSTDGAVRSLTTKYDSLGRVSQQTSHGNQTDDPDNTADIENQVVFTYNDLGLVTKSEQAHSGAVGMGTPSVQYAYDTSAASSVFDDGPRLESLTYPERPRAVLRLRHGRRAGRPAERPGEAPRDRRLGDDPGPILPDGQRKCGHHRLPAAGPQAGPVRRARPARMPAWTGSAGTSITAGTTTPPARWTGRGTITGTIPTATDSGRRIRWRPRTPATSTSCTPMTA